MKIINAVCHTIREVFPEVQRLYSDIESLEFLSPPSTLQSNSPTDGLPYVCRGETLFREMNRQSERYGEVPRLDHVE
jgi:hypothetical protein